MAILTRYPIVSSTSVPLPEGNEPRIALAVEVRLPGDRPLTIVNVHFDWVRDDAFRYAQATALTAYLDALTTPYVLLGDFNDVPESRTLGLIRSRATEAAKPEADRLTFSSTDPSREIDFVFFAPGHAFAAREVRVIDEPVASDHRPVLAVLRLAGGQRTLALPLIAGGPPAGPPRDRPVSSPPRASCPASAGTPPAPAR
jgi:endonuclease/exonuclease/phosphatase family metal-dependent hydrolase